MATYNSSFNNPYPSGWKNTPEQTTPITAEALQAHTDALQAIDDYLTANPIPESGGGGTGTTNYNDLSNKPSINGIELNGNKTSEQLGISGGTDDYEELDNKPKINGVELSGDLSAEDLGLSGGSGSGTMNYEELTNLPTIENVELKGNVTLAELGTKKQIRISWVDFQALPTEEREDLSVVYFIYDYPNTEYTASNIVYDDSLSNIGATNVQDAIQTVANIAKGRNQAHVFQTTADMQAWLSNADNKGLWSKGDNIYIVELDVPDWWVAEVLEEADSETGYYYKIAQLETQKVDLTNYLPLSGGTMTGTLNTQDLVPYQANAVRLGTNEKPFSSVRTNILNIMKNLATYITMNVVQEGTETQEGITQIIIGNSTPTGTNGNARGSLVLYNKNGKYGRISPNSDASSSNIEYNLPSKGGTLPTVTVSGTEVTINL